MTLETLAKDIAASADAEAKAMIKAAKADAKEIVAEAESKAETILSDANERATREAEQIAREIVASARQSNQKDVLVARRKVLDATLEAARSQIADPALNGRASILKGLMAQADEVSGSDYIICPVEIDRAALADIAGGRTVGDSVEGLGGFVLEAADGSVSYDLRFDNLLSNAWSEKRAAINSILFD